MNLIGTAQRYIITAHVKKRINNFHDITFFRIILRYLLKADVT